METGGFSGSNDQTLPTVVEPDMMDEFLPGDRVWTEPEEVVTDSFTPITLRQGSNGIVLGVDIVGDIALDFDGSKVLQWVYKANVYKICRAPSKPRGEKREVKKVQKGGGFGGRFDGFAFEDDDAQPSKQRRLTLFEGQRVKARLHGHCTTDNTPSETVERGYEGIVIEVDPENSDVLIDFDKLSVLQWMTKAKFFNNMNIQKKPPNEGKRSDTTKKEKKLFKSPEDRERFYASIEGRSNNSTLSIAVPLSATEQQALDERKRRRKKAPSAIGEARDPYR